MTPDDAAPADDGALSDEALGEAAGGVGGADLLEPPTARDTARRSIGRRALDWRPTRAPHRDPAAPAPAVPHVRVSTPTVLQMEAVECGAAALAMVLAHHGRIVPLEELRMACGVSRDGSKANNVLRAARTYGMNAKGFRKEPGELRTMAVPMIVHWNFNHFVVFEGFKAGRAYINDPGMGPTSVTEEEFDQAFTGVALTFERGPEFTRGGTSPSLLAALGRRLTGARLALVFVVLAGLALVLPGVVGPTYQRVYVDAIIVKGARDWLRPLLVLIGITALISAGLTWLQQYYLLRFETKLAVDTSGRFLWHVLRLPVEFFTQRYAGEIGGRVAINDKIAKLLSGELATTLLNVTVIIFYAALMLQYDLLLTAIGVTMASFNLLALRFVSRKRVDLNQRLGQERGKAMGAAMGGLQTIETLKASGAESDFFERWSGYQAKVVNSHQQFQLHTQLLAAVPPLLVAINTALILGIGGLRVMNGALSMGMLIAFQSLMSMFLSPVTRLVTLGSTLQEVKGDMNRLDDVLGAPRDRHADPDAPDASPHPGRAQPASATRPPADELTPVDLVSGSPQWKLSGALELRGITFGYSRLDPPLIRDFSLTLQPGSRVALVGGSGSGKSTIAKLVCGLYTPWSGDIMFDGFQRGEVARALLVNSVAAVDQEIFLFDGTIRDNITMWDSGVPDADVMRAAKDACIHEDVIARPKGYLSHVEEGGRNFSGGQRQRLEIARALVGNPSMLVLDEATSALDPSTEQRIDDQLRQRGCTCLIVAHRLSTIRDADEIIVLERGVVAQRGTHDEMAAVPGPYRDLIGHE
ncbi:MAG: NHLP family bacteriocin export ABC transporter peptidase/permease/ATPase subunit [Gemmatimonadaceae bacterium]|nr:NHLP family bacteriocin export ABC transporter peptidase/permease/ATPase subunit [Gemmatimonadaceae bacterium]